MRQVSVNGRWLICTEVSSRLLQSSVTSVGGEACNPLGRLVATSVLEHHLNLGPAVMIKAVGEF